MEVPPTDPATVKIWRWASAIVLNARLYECKYCKRKINILKEWRKATKLLKVRQLQFWVFESKILLVI
jgi:hypothetical protein